VKTFIQHELMGGLSVKVPIQAAGQFATSSLNTSMFVYTLFMTVIGFVIGLTVIRSSAQVRALSKELEEAGMKLTHSGSELNEASMKQNEAVTRQAALLEETHVTAQEIRQTSLMAAQKAEKVLQDASRAESIGHNGEAAIEQTLTRLSDIRAQIEEIAQRINQLNERTQQIGAITQTVKDLADQSNMLALNAAIEAVRSGEHGKGFAVVAREIRSLADQSIQATGRVREILEDIGAAIRETVVITEKGRQKMEAGLVQINSSGENLKELVSIVNENVAAVRQIAAAVNQQNAGISRIFTAVTDQTKMSEEAVKRLDTTNQAANVLKDVANRVGEVVKRIRI
jgi:methyl-accepting chemotaxis protein